MAEEQERLSNKVEKSRKAYRTPELREYGNVATLTQGGSFVGNDGNTKCTGNASTTNECAVS